MIVGEINADREVAILLTVRGGQGEAEEIEAQIDTGFTDFLTLPPGLVTLLQLPFREVSEFTVANGTTVLFEIYEATVVWDGQERRIPALASEGGALVGMSLLQGYRVTFDAIDGGSVTIIPIPQG